MTPYQRETLDNIRRAAERGRSLTCIAGYDLGYPPALDTFQHILDLVEQMTTKEAEGAVHFSARP